MKTEFNVIRKEPTKEDEERFDVIIKDYRGTNVFKWDKSQMRHFMQKMDNAIE